MSLPALVVGCCYFIFILFFYLLSYSGRKWGRRRCYVSTSTTTTTTTTTTTSPTTPSAAAATSADRADGWLAASPGLEQSFRPSFSSSGGGGGGGTGSPAIFNQTPRIPGQTTRNAERCRARYRRGARCSVALLHLSAASRVPTGETKQLKARGYSSSSSTEAARKQHRSKQKHQQSAASAFLNMAKMASK